MRGGSFYGVYLLCSESTEKRHAGKCYIGYTVNPDRRILQHNRGKDFGGAKRTSNRGPWKMVMIVHGFPNNIAALQFEWAWQQPALSSRLKAFPELRRKRPKESHFQYNFRILSRMLNVGPWHRLPLTVQWLQAEYKCEFGSFEAPPTHMKIVSSLLEFAKQPSCSQKTAPPPQAIWAPECHLCMQRIENTERSRIGCLNPLCKLTCHLVCLANHVLSSDVRNRGHYIPVVGECPLCELEFTWAALLERKRKMRLMGGVEEIELEEDEGAEDDDEGSDDFYASNDDAEEDSDDADNKMNEDCNDYFPTSQVVAKCDDVVEISD